MITFFIALNLTGGSKMNLFNFLLLVITFFIIGMLFGATITPKFKPLKLAENQTINGNNIEVHIVTHGSNFDIGETVKLYVPEK